MSIDKEVFRTWKRGGVYYVSYQKGKNAQWHSSGLRNYNEVVAKFSKGVPKDIDSTRITLGEFCKLFKERMKGSIRGGTEKGYELALRQFCNIVGADKKLMSLGVSDIEHFKRTRLQGETSATTVNIGLRYVRAALHKAHKWGYIPSIPDIEMLKQKRLPPKFITRDELDAILTHVTQDDFKDIFKFAFYTGCRISEILNLPWKHVDIERKQILIDNWERFETKNGKGRVVPMHETVGRILNKRMKKQKGDLVFHKGDGQPWSMLYISTQFKRAAKKVNKDTDIHFHTLRHSFASLLVAGGIPIYTVSKLLGHSSVTMTEIYSHLSPSVLHGAIAVLASSTAPSAQNKLMKKAIETIGPTKEIDKE